MSDGGDDIEGGVSPVGGGHVELEEAESDDEVEVVFDAGFEFEVGDVDSGGMVFGNVGIVGGLSADAPVEGDGVVLCDRVRDDEEALFFACGIVGDETLLGSLSYACDIGIPYDVSGFA